MNKSKISNHSQSNHKKIIGYTDFDCSSNTLHVGSLLQLMLLKWLQKTGNKPIVLLGGGTTKIGDPSGKDQTRQILSKKEIDKNIKCFCVGNATEFLAKEKGFQNIFSAEGNVNNLKEIILQNFKSSEGKLLYISGETITFELDKFLISDI